MEGIFSGTLSYIFNSLGVDTKFSDIVTQAKDAGFTEPDPRDDLAGMDVARKVTILARSVLNLLSGQPLHAMSILSQLYGHGSYFSSCCGRVLHCQLHCRLKILAAYPFRSEPLPLWALLGAMS